MFAASKTKGVSAVAANYIEDVFSTYLYTGVGANTWNNGIDLSTKGGAVWVKCRSSAYDNVLFDTVRGSSKQLITNATGAETTTNGVNAFTTTGFSTGSFNNETSLGGEKYASWTFRKQPKFFDVQTVSHTFGVDNTIDLSALGTVGCVIIKRIDGANNWYVWHRSLGNAYYGLFLNTNGAPSNFGTAPVQVSGTTVTMTDSSAVGGYFSTGTYVVYAWAHDAGGFGLTGTDNVISCGSYTTTGNDNVNLGYEPQFIIEKRVNGLSEWHMWDTMRGMSQTNLQELEANTSAAEVTIGSTGYVKPTATGYNNTYWSAGQTVIYIAIRRGPMKTPTSGTSVYSPTRATFSGTTVTDTGFVVDMVINKVGTNTTNNNFVFDRLRGDNNSTGQYVLPSTSSTSAETATSGYMALTGTVTIQNGFLAQDTTANNMVWAFRRAPGFFDEVCYTGTGSATTVTHNLGAVPELIIAKSRSGAFAWTVYSSTLGNSYPLFLNYTSDGTTNYGASMWGSTAPTATQFPVGTYTGTNSNGQTYVAYLFASCPGVSKVGSYTGNGTTQTINCGFTGGARFVLIKRTDSTGDWYVYDTARGMTVLTDPYLLLNSTAAESATLGSVITTSVGFIVDATILAAVNTNGASYIYLAIA